jgi:hypothetical protein
MAITVGGVGVCAEAALEFKMQNAKFKQPIVRNNEVYGAAPFTQLS